MKRGRVPNFQFSMMRFLRPDKSPWRVYTEGIKGFILRGKDKPQSIKFEEALMTF